MPFISLLASFLAQLLLTTADPTVIINDTIFYGQSPYVAPVNGTGAGNWSDAYSKAQSFVAQLTLEEKVNFTGGYAAPNGCSGNVPPLPRLQFPGMCLHDSGNSIRGSDFVSAYPVGIHVGASWNRDLAYARGYWLGGEFRAKGVNIALGPVVAPLGRIAEGGRNWEGFSNDPYLSGALVGPTVAAIQSNGVITSTKHFIAYEQETNRYPVVTTSAVSSNLDDQTMHELYLWPFAEAIYSGTGNIMCSYNKINNSYASQNSKTLNGLLKDELGFQGFVVSDWGAQQSGVASALGGLDMAQNDTSVWGPDLIQAVQNGSVPEWRVDDMVIRIMASYYQMGQDSSDFPAPGVGIPANLLAPHTIVNARNPESKSTILQSAIEGHVLVKNINNALPLQNPLLLSLFGYDAIVPTQYGPENGLADFAWLIDEYGVNDIDLECEFIGISCGTIAQYATNTLWSGGGSGGTTPPYIDAPYDAISNYSIINNIALYWDFTDTTVNVDAASDACLVFINAFSTEEVDRTGLHDDYSDGLVENVASQCNNTIVVIHNAGIRLVDQWIDNPNVTAVIFAHLPGQDTGRALVEILFGLQSPSGKLPYTIAKNESDYGPLLAPSEPEGAYIFYPQSNFTEGVYIDYKAFDQLGIEPRYEFGFGLTYTTFEYSAFNVQVTASGLPVYPTGKTIPGGPSDLYDVIAQVTATVTNTGSFEAAEIAQLYVGLPGPGSDQPLRQLRGFDKVTIAPGNSAQVSFPLRRKDLSVWDVVAQQWTLQHGTYQLYVGASSRNLPLTGTLTF